ncbi:MAG: DNA polymerase III subunit delta [Pseudomonadota bacterium]
MAARKAHEVDAYLAKPDPAHCVFLLYGPDAGLVAERGQGLINWLGIDQADPFSLIKLDGDTMDGPSALVEEAHTVAMFGGGKRALRFRPGGMRNPADAIKPLKDNPPDDAIVVVEAGDLAKGHALRKAVEAMPNGVALPCYQDEVRALARVVDQELSEHKLHMDRPTREHLLGLLGSDRMVSRNEVRKLCLYCLGQDAILREDVDAIVGDAGASAVDEVVDAAGVGRLDALEVAFRRLEEAGTATFLCLSAALRQFQTYHAIRARHEAGDGPVKGLLDGHRPPIYFKRKQAALQVLMRWDARDLLAVCNRLSDAIRDGRTNPTLEPEIARAALTAIALQSQRRR